MSEQQGGVKETPMSEREWFKKKNANCDAIEAREKEREPRIKALEDRIGALLKDRPESKKVTVETEEGEYANIEKVPAVHATEGDNSSFIPIDGL